MSTSTRLPLADRARQLTRDMKLGQREEAIANRQRARKRKCPYNICMGLNHSMRYRKVVAERLRTYGRHPIHRGSTEDFEQDESDLEWDAKTR
ncbi:hypothetical protein M758_UG266000 [Ceratodon purpureus]|nr:hypothetical protein M758_UG266000 [Ceratodon purpureus]